MLATSIGRPPTDVTFAGNRLAAGGRVVAYKRVERGTSVALEPAWQSRDLVSPLAPVVVNGLVFAVSSGEYRPAHAGATLTADERARRSVPAVLYVLDAASGKTLWTSGTKITSFARAGLAAGAGQVCLVTYDNPLS